MPGLQGRFRKQEWPGPGLGPMDKAQDVNTVDTETRYRDEPPLGQ